jgi:ABC transporter DrrB family efflux protein
MAINALPTGPTAALTSPTATAGPATTALSVAHRTIRKFLRTPQLVVVGTVQGVMFLLIFRYVFGGAIGAGGLDYVEFLIPGFIVTGVLFSGTGAAAGVAEDIEHGFFDRLRSLPISRTSVLLGRSLADTALVAWGAAVSIAIGFAVGFRIDSDWPSATAAFGLTVLFGFTFTWVFIVIGLFAGNAQAAQGMSLLVFPLTFVSSAYVPVDSMPGWMQSFAEHQPLTVMVNAVRGLTLGDSATAVLGHSTTYYVVASLLWSAGFVLVFAPIAAARYRQG